MPAGLRSMRPFAGPGRRGCRPGRVVTLSARLARRTARPGLGWGRRPAARRRVAPPASRPERGPDRSCPPRRSVDVGPAVRPPPAVPTAGAHVVQGGRQAEVRRAGRSWSRHSDGVAAPSPVAARARVPTATGVHWRCVCLGPRPTANRPHPSSLLRPSKRPSLREGDDSGVEPAAVGAPDVIVARACRVPRRADARTQAGTSPRCAEPRRSPTGHVSILSCFHSQGRR